MNYKLILLLNGTTRQRLERLKALAQRYPHIKGLREVYRLGLQPLTMSHYPINASDLDKAHARFFQSELDCGLRRLDWADRIINIRHTGWYSDLYQEETFRGIVFRLPAHKGENRFVAGYEESLNGGFVLNLTEIWQNERNAACEADRLAERAAESNRLYEAKEAANSRIDEIEVELKNIRVDILDLCRSVRKSCPIIGEHQPIRYALRQVFQQHLHNRQSLICERECLRENFWSVLPV